MRNYNKVSPLYYFQLIFAVIVTVYLVFFSSWKLQTNLLTIAPSSHNNVTQKGVFKTLHARQTTVINVLIMGDDAEQAYHYIDNELGNMSGVFIIKSPNPTPAQISQFYQPYKNNVLTDEYEFSLSDDEKLKEIIFSQLTAFSNPFVSETLSFAPKLNVSDYLTKGFSKLSSFELINGLPSVFLDKKRYFILSVNVEIDGFSIEKSEHLSSLLLQIFQVSEEQYQVEIIHSGILFHTAQSSVQAEFEIMTFGALSLVGVLLLIWITFKSITPLIISATVLFIANMYGMMGILLFFDEVHLLTLVFVVTLIGIVIDYCFHSYVFDYTEPYFKLVKPLFLGFITTALGYFCLLFSPLALLSQVAVFMFFGLFGALITVLFFGTLIKDNRPLKITPFALSLSLYIQRIINQYITHKNLIHTVLISVMLGGFLWQSFYFNDDVRLLNSSSAELIENERKTAEILNYRNRQTIFVVASSTDKLLSDQEKFIDKLKQQEGLVINSLVDLMPSPSKQSLNFNKLQSARNKGLFNEAYSTIGQVDEVMDFVILSYDDFLLGPLGYLAEMYVMEVESNACQFEGKQHEQCFAARLDVSGELLNENNLTWISGQQGIFVFDQAKDISLSLTKYREQIIYLLFFSFLIVSLILLIKYQFSKGIRASFSILISACGALLLTQVFNSHLNIFNLLAVLLILALSIDYIIFYLEHGQSNRTILAITLSSISSILVFGMLVFSATPAVSSFGLTTLLGLSLIYFLAPLSIDNQLGIKE